MVHFEQFRKKEIEPLARLLSQPYTWYVGSKTGCSCTFRHLMSDELGFSEPVYWYREDKDEIDATLKLYEVIGSLVSSGYKVDIVDMWEGTNPDNVLTMDVSLRTVPPQAFRLFENYKFIITV